MRIIFSRKGFDSAAGRAPSPIINGVPISLPIPGGPAEIHTYADISHPTAGPLGPIVERVTFGAVTAADRTHADPVLPWDAGIAILGQGGAAAAHLTNQGVAEGDVFVFFGLFEGDGEPPHHRIFGTLEVNTILRPGPNPPGWEALGLAQPHPHSERQGQEIQNTIYIGPGQLAHRAHPGLRLSRPGRTPSLWTVPAWLNQHGLSYHAQPDRWDGSTLKLVNRGQEFVCDVGDCPEARNWLADIRDLIAAD